MSSTRPHELEDLLRSLAREPHGVLEAVLEHAQGFSPGVITEALEHGLARVETEPYVNKLSEPVRRLFITPMGEQLLAIDVASL